MDNATTTVISFTGFAFSLLTMVYGAINHRRIRSNCCGRTLEASLDISATTPDGSRTVTASAPTL